MAVTFEGQATNANYQSQTTISYSSTQGNTLVLCVQHHGQSTSPTISDSAGNTWTVVDDLADATGNEGKSTMYVCFNADAITSVTIPSGSSARIGVLMEFSGVASVRATAASYAQYPASHGASVAADAGDLLISHDSVWSQNDASPTPSSGWTATGMNNVGTNNRLAAAYQLDTAGGTESIMWTMPSGVAKHGVIIASFAPAAPSIHSGSATIEWSVSTSASGTAPAVPPASGQASLAWEAGVSSTGSTDRSGQASLAWEVGVSSTGSTDRSGQASLAWEAGASSTGSTDRSGQASLAWEAGVSSTGSAPTVGGKSGGASLAWEAGISSTGSTDRSGQASLAWEAGVAAAGVAPILEVSSGSAGLSHTWSIGATGSNSAGPSPRDITIQAGPTFANWSNGPVSVKWAVDGITGNPLSVAELQRGDWYSGPVAANALTAGSVTDSLEWGAGPVAAGWSAGPIHTDK